MTSLQQQLKKLSVPYVEHVLEAKKASLLFDSKDAASLDIETVLDLALEGLSHLIKINSSFSRYKNVLFDKTAVKFNRASQAKETNEKLDAIIQQYLVELSPYFLMRPAQQTLEWLVHRYQIQLHNIDDWILTIMSFHNSKMFVRVLSIIDLEQPTHKWHWLNNCAKHGSPLPRVVIVNHCKKDVGFLRFLLSSVKMFVEVMNQGSECLSIMINFCFEICLDLIKISHEVTQEIVSTLVQFLINGIESKCLAWEERCYEYLPRLTACVNLADDKIFYFCRKISKHHSDNLVRSAILCLNLLVCQCDCEFEKKIFKRFAITDSKLQEIVKIVREMNILKFLELLTDVDSSGSIQQILDQLKDASNEKEEMNTHHDIAEILPVPMEVEEIKVHKPVVTPKHILDWIALLASDDQKTRIKSIHHLDSNGPLKKGEQYSSIFKKIFRRKEEIKEDSSHLLVLFKEKFSSDKTELESSLSSILEHITNEKTSLEFKKYLIKCFKLTNNQLVVSFFSKLVESQASVFQNESHISCLELIQALLECLSGYPNNCSDYTAMIVGLLSLNDCNKEHSLSMLAVDTIASSPDSVRKEDQNKILKALIELGLNASFSHKIQKACRKFEITADLISSVLNLKSIPRDENGPKLKRMRLNDNLIDVQKAKFILETLQGSKTIDHNGMCSVLSSIVSILASDNKDDGEYCCQLALVCLHRVIKSKKSIEDLNVNIESLAQCLRQVSSFQTQQHILIVMTAIAPALPRELLHNIVAVFAFMGNELLERDDKHSFEILTSLVDVALKSVKQLMESVPEATTTLIEVLRIFVDSRFHIPQHRLKPLFNQLVSVDVEEYLWRVIVLFAESSVCKRNASDSDDESKKQQLAQDQDIIRSIVSSYPTETLLSLMKNLTKFLRSILTATKKGNVELLDQSILKNHHLCQLIFKYLSKIIMVLIESQNMGTSEDPSFIKELAEETLNLMQDIDDQRKIADKESAAFFSSRMEATANIFKKMNQFLPGKSFVELLGNVLNQESSSIKFKGLQLLQFHLCAVEKKLVVVKGSECILTLVPRLIELTNISENKENMKIDLHVKQLSFFVLKLMCRIFGSDYSSQFTGMYDVLMSAINPEDVSNLIITDSALLCLSEYIAAMKTRLIPKASSIASAITRLYKNEKFWKSHDAINCLNVAANKLLLHLGLFLGAGLNDLIIDLCCLPSRAAGIFEKCSAEFSSVVNVLGMKTESRILLPVLIDSYDRLVKDNVCGIETLFNIYFINCKQLSKESLDLNLKVVTEIAAKFLNVRDDASSLADDKLISIENVYVESLLAFLPLLSEKTFRHLFDELHKTASATSVNIITFFNLMFGFSKQLRSIFNLFSKNLISIMTSSLDCSETFGTKSSLLLKFLLNLIGQCHLNDIDGSFALASSKSLYKSVVNQLENFAGGKDEFLKRVEEDVISCLVQMMQSVKEVEILQELHKAICLKSRHENPLVRISTIRSLTAIAESLGNSYDVLFPDLAPCISELLEDDDEKVAQECHRLQTVLEKTVGSLNKYF